jgi:hypothetical protein
VEVEQAMLQVKTDYQNAWNYASTPQERNNAELDMAFISGDWRGMPARFERFAEEQGCDQPNWDVNLALPFGYAKSFLGRELGFTICDPFASGVWRSAVRAQLWAGDPEAALLLAQQGSEAAPGEWLSFLLVMTRVALGQLEEAEAEISARLQVATDALEGRLMIAAARGDRNQVSRLLKNYYSDPQASDFWELINLSWAGERDRVNQVAARIDQHAFGSQTLASTLLWCLCGAAFDLSATPNFAADIEESGLSWPPATPIKFPLKNW